MTFPDPRFNTRYKGKFINIIDRILSTAESYLAVSDIEQLVDHKTGLRHIPLWSLHRILKKLPPLNCSKYLHHLNSEQRQALADIDLWEKDDLDIEYFHFWPLSYSGANDDVRFEFVKSSSFSLFLKGRFNIWTFDIEDPQYPDHDYYFLTEDNLLLIEYGEDYPYAYEIKGLIKDLYTDLGVEKAYAHLLKIVSETYTNMLEEEYRLKNHRLRDYGFVDYYDALDLATCFPTRGVMDHAFLRKKVGTGSCDEVRPMQNLHDQALMPFKDTSRVLGEELEKVQDSKRLNFLQFNFIRLVNATLVLDGTLKSGRLSMSRTGRTTRAMLLLGFNYILEKMGQDGRTSLFDRFEFTDFYRCGVTLIKGRQKEIRKAIRESAFKDESVFLGSHWERFLEESLSSPAKWKRFDGRIEEIISMENFDAWSCDISMLVKIIPFADKFVHTFSHLKETHILSDDFYLNYCVDEIDFEAIILSSLANFVLGNYKDVSSKKMGITLGEFKHFISFFGHEGNKIEITKKNKELITNFIQQFGFDSIPRFDDYIHHLIGFHLGGYEYSKLKESDYCHVGGPIILSHQI